MVNRNVPRLINKNKLVGLPIYRHCFHFSTLKYYRQPSLRLGRHITLKHDTAALSLSHHHTFQSTMSTSKFGYRSRDWHNPNICRLSISFASASEHITQQKMSTNSTATLVALDEGHEATQSLTLPYRGPAPHSAPLSATSQNFAYHPSRIPSDPNKIFRTHVVNMYKTDRLGSKTWSCQVCGKGATKVYHSATSLLSPLGSNLIDELIFTCNAPRCSNYGSDLANHFGKHQIPESAATSCENCDRRSNVKLCGGCTFSCKFATLRVFRRNK